MIETRPRNRFLASLDARDLDRLAPHLQRLRVEGGAALLEVEQEIREVWFPESCVISLTVAMGEGGSPEAAMIGREGAAGLVGGLGGRHAFARGVVQVPGLALRLPLAPLRAAFEASPGLRQHCLCYADALLAHVLQSSACSALHTVEARLSRWLLELQDRIEGEPTLPLTHEFLAEMLGVHRTTLTMAARVLRRAGLIAYRRGQVTVLDRAGLEEACCECYAAVRAHYERLLPRPG
jgi:CRP-like cAMP-binding protein